MNLIGANERLVYESVIGDIHDTFSRPILVYKTPETTIVSTDTNYNYFYDGPDANTGSEYVEYTPVSGIVNARIQYDKTLEKYFASAKGKEYQDFELVGDAGMVRLKINSGDYSTYFADAIDIQFDGFQFENFRTQRPHGLFSPKYYSLYLRIKN
jgi:hypothetical protein